MGEKKTDYIIHPEVHWVHVGNDRLQLRQPNGDNVTFDKHVLEIANILNFFKQPSNKLETINEDIFTPLTELLISKGFLISKKEMSSFQFERIADLHPNKNIKYKENRLPKSVSIIGEGILHNLIKNSLLEAKIKINESDNPNSLKLVITDSDDYLLLNKENEKAIKRNQLVLFFRWSNGLFKIGPFVTPGETACLECATQREIASNLFPDEMNAYLNSNVTDLPKYQGGPVLDNLASSIITRQVLLILRGDYDVLGTSSILTVDPLLLKFKHSPILRLPKCKVCSSKEQQPSKNYHNLLLETHLNN